MSSRSGPLALNSRRGPRWPSRQTAVPCDSPGCLDATGEGARRGDRRSVAADRRPPGVPHLRRPCRGRQRRNAVPVDGPQSCARGHPGEHVLPVGGQERIEVGKAAARPEARAERNARGGPCGYDLPVPGHRREHASARCEGQRVRPARGDGPDLLARRDVPGADVAVGARLREQGAVVAEGRAGRELAVHRCALESGLEAAESGDGRDLPASRVRQTPAAPSRSSAATSLESGLKTTPRAGPRSATRSPAGAPEGRRSSEVVDRRDKPAVRADRGCLGDRQLREQASRGRRPRCVRACLGRTS